MSSDLSKVTRLEVIDHTACPSCKGTGRIDVEGAFKGLECPACHGTTAIGRQVILNDPSKKIEGSLQDDGRTLKIFIDGRD
tara:strand:- start:1847 stop:2089 length:243 start_codon:yes stop_codon:yes gene_type:complete